MKITKLKVADEIEVEDRIMEDGSRIHIPVCQLEDKTFDENVDRFVSLYNQYNDEPLVELIAYEVGDDRFAVVGFTKDSSLPTEKTAPRLKVTHKTDENGNIL